MSTAVTVAPKAAVAISTITLAGATAGAIDFIYATARTIAAGGSALTPWKGVAAALLGVQAIIKGGDAMAIVGAGLHFLITIIAAAIYYAVARRTPLRVQHAVVSGVIYGILFLLALNYLILPLTVIGKPLYVGAQSLAYAAVSHVLMIGLPIALIVAWRLKPRPGRRGS